MAKETTRWSSAPDMARTLGKGVLWFAFSIIILIIVVLAALQFQPVRQGLLQYGLAKINKGETQIAIGDLKGNWPRELHLSDITISDTQGVWLRIDEAELTWSPTALFRGQVHILDFAAKTVDISRAPLSAETETDIPASGFSLPSLPVAVKLDQGRVDNIIIGRGLVDPEASGTLARLKLSTMLNLAQETLDLSLEIARNDQLSSHLKLVAGFDQRNKSLSLDLTAKDGDKSYGGLLNEITGLGDGPLSLTAQASGVDGKVDGQMTLDNGRSLSLQVATNGKWTNELALAITAKASGTLITDALDGLGTPPEVALATTLTMDRRGTIGIDNLILDAGTLTLKGAGSFANAMRTAPHKVEAQGTIEGVDRLLDAEGDASLSSLDWSLDAYADMAKNTANIGSFKISSPGFTSFFKGDVALDGTTLKGESTITADDLSSFSSLAGRKLTGSASATLSPFLLEKSGTLTGDFTIRTKNIKTGDTSLDALVGAITADGTLLANSAGGITLPSFNVIPLTGDYALSGNFASTPVGVLSGEVMFSANDIGKIVGQSTARGAFNSKIKFSGTTEAPALTLHAALTNGAINGQKTKTLTLDAKASQNETGPVSLAFDGAPGKARIDANLLLPSSGGAKLDGISGNLFGSQLTGFAHLDNAGLVSAKLESNNFALASLAQLAGTDLRGNGALIISAEPVDGTQSLIASFTSPRLDVQGVTFDRTQLDFRMDDLLGTPQINAHFNADAGQLNLVHLDNVDVNAKGPLNALALDAAITGVHETATPKPFSLSTQAIMHSDKISTLDLSVLKVALGDAHITLAGPQKLHFSNGFSAKALQFDMDGRTGNGSLTGDIAINSTARIKLHLDNAPLDLASLVMAADTVRGKANGNVDLDTSNGKGSVKLRFDEIGVTQDIDDTQPVYSATMDSVWAKGRLDSTIVAQGASTAPFTLKASLPVIRKAGSAFPQLASRGRVTGSLDWDGPLASLAALADLNGQRVAGNALVALSASGDISAPVINGSARISNGEYENFFSGTLLKSIEAELTGQRSETLGFKLTATDGAAGRISGEGTIELDADSAQPIDIRLEVDNAKLVRRSDVDATLDGEINLTGPAFPPTLEEPALLKGNVTTRNLHIRIPDSLPVDVPLVEVIEINGPNPDNTMPVDGATPIPLMLDLSLKTGTPARISGRGIDSLWSGDLAVAGRADKPQVKGKLNSERGTLDFAGKTFTLKKGVVNFPGGYPVAPDFVVTLSYSRDDFTATINVSGNSAKPTISFSSSPSYPKDEILARILFNKGVGELSPVEALQLARTLAELSGVNIGGNGAGIMDRVQETLSLDVLRLDSSASGAATVSAGKYIQEGIYVGVEQGALASDSSVKVEVEVTPQISLDTRIGQNASSDIGVNWKWDY
tara:strand:- start:53370 stop:57566 length:4197 start_codon:yes stop_codon:yes gene_type:complete